MEELYRKIEDLLQGDRVLLSIEGGAASGKTTLADKLQQKYGGEVYHMDDFFLPPELRTAERLSQVGGNVHYERFRTEVICGILSGKAFSYGVFDCKEGRVTKTKTVSPGKLHIIEGVYSAHPYFGDIYDIRIFLDIDEKTQRARILKRNGEKAEQFFHVWIPMENQYFKAYQIKEKSDISL